MSPPRWDNNTTCKFVELYVQHECLWNMNLAIYRNKQARNKAMKEIVKEMAVEDFGIEEAKQKIKSIRATYQQEQTKVIKSEKSGAGSEDIYKPNMKWFAAMKDVMHNGQLKRNTTSNMAFKISTENDDIIEADNERILSEEDTQQSDFHEHVSCNPTNNEETQNIKRPIDTPSNRTDTPPSKRTQNKLAEVKAAIQDLKGLNQAISRADVEDECDVFGKHIAMQLKKLPDEICITAQAEIQCILTRSRLNALQSGRFSACSTRSGSSQHADISNPTALKEKYFSTPITSPLPYDPCGTSNVTYIDAPSDILSATLYTISDDSTM